MQISNMKYPLRHCALEFASKRNSSNHAAYLLNISCLLLPRIIPSLALVATLLGSLLGLPHLTMAEEPFKPVWSLMNRKEKQQFIAGYLYGMRDAATLTNYLREFVRDNPQSSEESLERLRALYSGLSEGKPDSVAAGIDGFYKDSKNREAPLSRAITAIER